MKVLLQVWTGARMLPNCTAILFTTRLYGETRARYQTLRRFFISEFKGICTFFTTRLYGHTTRLHGTRRLQIWWASAHFVDYQIALGNHPHDGSFFPSRKPILFDNILHLLYSGIHFDLYHSRSILHKTRDGYWPLSLGLPDCTGHITKQLGGGLEFEGFCPFFDYQTARGQPPWLWLFFSPPITDHFNIIVIHL